MTEEAVNALTARRAAVLSALSMLSEARGSRAMTPDELGRAGGNTTAPPPGVNLDRIRSQQECPDKDRSLFEFYAWQFTRKGLTVTDITKLCFLAERDLEARQRTGVSTQELHRARNRSILSSKYVDQPPDVVAACESCSGMHVRNWRKKNGLDPTTGRFTR